MSDHAPEAPRPWGPDPEEVRRLNGRARLGILAALDEALRRHDELIPIIVDSADRSAACLAVAEVLGVGEVEASAVLDLQWGRMTRAERARIANDRAEQDRDLAD